MGRDRKNILFIGVLLSFAALLATCFLLPNEVETAAPSVVPSPAPSPVEATPSPTPIPTPAETDPPAWTGQAVNFTGEWHRTEKYIAFPSTIEITDQTETGFTFSLEAYYYSHIGTVSGTAYFTDENAAFWRCVPRIDDTADGCLFFTMEDGSLKIDEEGQLPFGMNVSACGVYTTGKPVYYTNGVLEALGPDRIALLQEAAGENYQEFLGTPLEYGDFTVEEYREDSYSGLLLEGWMPTMGYQQKIYVGDDGAVWANFWTGQCFTNRPDEEIPGFLLYPENKGE